MFEQIDHYYIIRRESKFIYYLTLVILFYFNFFWLALLYALLWCNLIFDDEDEDPYLADTPDYFWYADFGLDTDIRNFLLLNVSYITLNEYMECVIDLPILDNSNERKLLFFSKFDNIISNFEFYMKIYYSQKNNLFYKYNYFLWTEKDNILIKNNLNTPFVFENKIKETQTKSEGYLKTSHFFKSVSFTSMEDIKDRDTFGLNMFAELLNSRIFNIFHKWIQKKELNIERKADLAYNDYIFQSYVATGLYFTGEFEFYDFYRKLLKKKIKQ